MPQPWHQLLAPLPADAVVERTPVASFDPLATLVDWPIVGWESLSVYLVDGEEGLRHVMITLDEKGAVLAANDAILSLRAQPLDAGTGAICDHHSIGGRFENDGSFRGTVWQLQTAPPADAEDNPRTVSSTPSAPTPDQVAALRRLVAEVMRRAPAKSRGQNG